MEDVVVELNRLQVAGIVSSYAIGGAIGSNVYLETTHTDDVDVFVVVSGPEANALAPLRRIYADLLSHGVQQEGERLLIGGWPVQFLMSAGPLYDAAIAHARDVALGNQTARVMGPEHLAAIALNTARAKDFVRLHEFIRTRTIDMDLFEALVEQFGLTEKWKKFQTRFLAEP